MNKFYLIFYRRMTGEEVDEIPPHALDLMVSMGETQVRNILIATDLKYSNIGKVAIRYGVHPDLVRSVGRNKRIVK